MLNEINSPQDLKNLKMKQLPGLAQELRAEIIKTVAARGGHLSSNLGMVELTLALDYVFDYPADRLIFDVGHQAYAHKLLTGRQARFSTLRAKGGLSGYPTPLEDPNDSFTAGHASTSISAALGLCRARDLKGEKNAVVAIIGDGSLTGGMSYEALNDAGQSSTRLIVILNHNEMSISKNVGAVSMHLTKIRQSFFYRHLKSGTRNVLSHIPLVGRPLTRMMERLRNMMKAFVMGDNLFDSMGFQYVGPVDGHDIQRLVHILRGAKATKGPIVIHVVTQKGKGYPPAEQSPDKYHGALPFDIETGRFLSEDAPGCGALAAEILADLAENRPEICAVTAAMPIGTGLSVFGARHPGRCFDVGIAEAHAVTMAAGLAASGMKPYVAIYSTFLQRAYDQISNDVCLNALPVTFLIDRAGLVGSDGATHNGAFDLSYLRSLPNMTIVAPRDAHALRRVLRWSVGFSGPLAIRYPKDALDLGDGLIREGEIVPGRAERLLEGEIQIIAVGRMVRAALGAAVLLQSRGISAGVVDAMFVKPLDKEMILGAACAGRLLVTIEENTISGGFGEAALQTLARAGVRADALLLGLPDKYVEHAKVSEQLEACGLDAEGIAAAILKKLDGLN
jgi:1-deoxy-D-xylulose-5-phosphate synthase